MQDIQTVFIEAFLARLAPIFREVHLTATLHFTPDAYPLLAVIAAVATLMMSFLWYRFGEWLGVRYARRLTDDAQRERMERMQTGARQWLPWLLILSASPFGSILIIGAGFFQIPRGVSALAIIAAQLLWRASPLLR